MKKKYEMLKNDNIEFTVEKYTDILDKINSYGGTESRKTDYIILH